MTDTQITKIILLRGVSADLPHQLDTAELGFSTNEGRLFVGSDPIVGQAQYQRVVFPYQNIEVLTENSTAVFAKLHGDRMKEGGGLDYYQATFDADTTTWTNVNVLIDNVLQEYRITDLTSVSAFIDYSVTAQDGTPIKSGTMTLNYSTSSNSQPMFSDHGVAARDLSQISPRNYDPNSVYNRVLFQFAIQGPSNAPFLSFQYQNLTTGVLNLRFKVSRPEAVYYE